MAIKFGLMECFFYVHYTKLSTETLEMDQYPLFKCQIEVNDMPKATKTQNIKACRKTGEKQHFCVRSYQ